MTGFKPETKIMGILNVTPDSFSDGGEFFSLKAGLQRAYNLFELGADILDVGGESTRPGAESVSVSEEIRRLKPVVEELTSQGLGGRLSVDTRKREVIEWAVERGVGIINDVSGGSCGDDCLAEVAKAGATYISMHMFKTPKTMQESPMKGGEACSEVEQFYYHTSTRFLSLGFPKDRIWLDPGIGFGKTDAANIQLLAQATQLAKSYPLVIGVSRKSFIGRQLDIENPHDRDSASKMLELGMIFSGVKVVRTHQVGPLVRFRKLLSDGCM